jgi:hypothetical protein
MNIFKLASRKGFRFNTPMGELSVEQLWNLGSTRNKTMIALNDIAVGLDEEIAKLQRSSYLETKSTEQTDLVAKRDIVVDILQTLIAERDTEKVQAANKVEREKLMQLIAAKDQEELSSLSKDELLARLNAIDA